MNFKIVRKLPEIHKLVAPFAKKFQSTFGGAQDFQPGYGGFPFPPMMMTGPYYSAPYGIKFNILPFPA